MGAIRFGVPRNLVLWARDQFGIRTFVESGTNRARTAVWAAGQFPSVVSIEAQRDLYEAASSAYGDRKSLRFLHGDSGELLAKVLAELSEPAILWLDAHWCGAETYGIEAECPLLKELAAVNESRLDHVILIDDARLFLAPPPLPHNFRDWPSLVEIGEYLNRGTVPRYAAVFEDVIVSVSQKHAEPLVDFIRTQRQIQGNKLWRRVARTVLKPFRG